MCSDVQVTLHDGQTKDLIQKAYPVGNFVAAGFSGSVRIGFSLIESLREFLALSPQEALTEAWDPAWVFPNWAPIAKSIFDGAPMIEKDCGAQFLALGA